MGEFSAPRWTGEAGNRYIRDVIEICEQHGWSWAYHAWREWEGWDAERSNTEKSDTARKAVTPRLELLKSFYRRNAESKGGQQLRDQRGAVGDPVHQDALVRRVRAFADTAQAVERRNAQRGGEVAVRAAAGQRLLQSPRPVPAPVSAPCGRVARFPPSAPSAAGSTRPSLRCGSACRPAAAPRNLRSSPARPSAARRACRLPPVASAATTFERVPPEITPGFTVMPRSQVGEAGDAIESAAPVPGWRWRRR